MNATVERFDELASEVLRRPPRLGQVRAVAVDGPSGAGKTTFADRLAGAVSSARARVEVVHTDDLLDGWDDQFAFWHRLDSGILAPLRAGQAGRYPVYDWQRATFGDERLLPVPDVLILEGGTTARAGARPELTLSVFLDAPADLRVSRATARDGAAIWEPLGRWMTAETRHFAADGTREWVDRLVDGAPTVGHDPEKEFVRLPESGADHD